VIWSKTKPWLIYIENVTIIVYIVMILGATPFVNIRLSAGIILGGALGWANFDLLIRIGERVFKDPEHPQMSYFIFTWVKFCFILVVLFFSIRSGWYHPVGLALGVSNFVLGVFLGTLIWALQKKALEKDEDSTESGELRPPGKTGLLNIIRRLRKNLYMIYL